MSPSFVSSLQSIPGEHSGVSFSSRGENMAGWWLVHNLYWIYTCTNKCPGSAADAETLSTQPTALVPAQSANVTTNAPIAMCTHALDRVVRKTTSIEAAHVHHRAETPAYRILRLSTIQPAVSPKGSVSTLQAPVLASVVVQAVADSRRNHR